MPLPLVPLALLGLTGAAYWKVSTSHYGVMTPERQQIYDAALTNLKDPTKLRMLAEQFDKQGLSAYGDLLRKRADIRELPPNVRFARRKAFEQAMASENVEAMEKIAIAFDREGATGAAAAIRNQIHIVKTRPSPEEVKEVLQEIGVAANPNITEIPKDNAIKEVTEPVKEIIQHDPVVLKVEVVVPKTDGVTETGHRTEYFKADEMIIEAKKEDVPEVIEEKNENGRNGTESKGDS